MAKKFTFFKKQIFEIEDIKETVKALEKISAANVHNLKVVSQTLSAYEEGIKKILSDMAEGYISHWLFQEPMARKRLKIILTAESGLCGALLNRLLDFVEASLGKNDKILVVGGKGKSLCRERGIKVDYFFQTQKDIPKKEDIKELRSFVLSQFLEKKVNKVLIYYSGFESLAVQEPKVFDFLPVEKEKFKEEIGKEEEFLPWPIYEPSKKEVIDYLLSAYLDLVFYQKVLEAKLSELSARTVAMEEAVRKAEKLSKQILHQYFREKRREITKEITDLYIGRRVRKQAGLVLNKSA